jgi:hypothetical protein
VTASAHAPAIANAVRIGLMVFLPDGQLSALCPNRNGQIFLLSLPNVTLPLEAVKADRKIGHQVEGKCPASSGHPGGEWAVVFASREISAPWF